MAMNYFHEHAAAGMHGRCVRLDRFVYRPVVRLEELKVAVLAYVLRTRQKVTTFGSCCDGAVDTSELREKDSGVLTKKSAQSKLALRANWYF
jgi:hypothetical protein